MWCTMLVWRFCCCEMQFNWNMANNVWIHQFVRLPKKLLSWTWDRIKNRRWKCWAIMTNAFLHRNFAFKEDTETEWICAISNICYIFTISFAKKEMTSNLGLHTTPCVVVHLSNMYCAMAVLYILQYRSFWHRSDVFFSVSINVIFFNQFFSSIFFVSKQKVNAPKKIDAKKAEQS